jgi:hypothetical protein
VAQNPPKYSKRALVTVTGVKARLLLIAIMENTWGAIGKYIISRLSHEQNNKPDR